MMTAYASTVWVFSPGWSGVKSSPDIPKPGTACSTAQPGRPSLGKKETGRFVPASWRRSLTSAPAMGTGRLSPLSPMVAAWV